MRRRGPSKKLEPVQLEMEAIVEAPERKPGRGGRRKGAGRNTRMVGDGVLDAMSSATRFTWWTRPMRWPFPEPSWPDATPSTWLLGTGWRTRGGGPIDPNEVKRGG